MFIIYLLSSSLLISSCKKECNVLNDDTTSLGIDEMSRFSGFEYKDGIVDIYHSHRWNWLKHNDTIEVSGYVLKNPYQRPFEYELKHLFFLQQNDNTPPKLISNRLIIKVQAVYDWDGSVLDDGYRFHELSDDKMKVQEYIKDEILVTRIGNTKIWIEFSPDNIRNTPYEYEQYYQ